VHCCFSDTGPVHGASASLASVRETFTKADLCRNAIGDHPGVANHIRCVGIATALTPPLHCLSWLRDGEACTGSANLREISPLVSDLFFRGMISAPAPGSALQRLVSSLLAIY
jgi:hypothetical protein